MRRVRRNADDGDHASEGMQVYCADYLGEEEWGQRSVFGIDEAEVVRKRSNNAGGFGAGDAASGAEEKRAGGEHAAEVGRLGEMGGIVRADIEVGG